MKYIANSQIKNMKNVAKELYLESRRFPGPIEEQNSYLNMLIEKIVEKAYEKNMQGDTEININNYSKIEDSRRGFQKELGILVEKYQKGLQ